MTEGQIVCSRAGSDKDRFLVLVGFDGKDALICDGKRYKLASPKRKNQKHLAATQTILNMESISTDKALRKALAVYRSNMR